MKQLTTVNLVCMLALLCQMSAASAAGSAKSAEPELPYGKVTTYGLFKARISGWVRSDAVSSTGKVIHNPTLEFRQETDRVPLRQGVVFGYRYWLEVLPDNNRPEFRRVLIHPEMTLPDGVRVSRSERRIRKRATYGVVTSIDAYALSEEYELVEGDWTFQLWLGDELLVEQRFTTYQPDPERVPSTAPEYNRIP